MKYGLIYILILLVFFPLVVSGQHVESTFRFSDVRLSKRNDSLCMEMDITIPRGALSNCQQWQLTPRVQTESKSMNLPVVTITDKKRAKLHKRAGILSQRNDHLSNSYFYRQLNRKEEGHLVYRASILYEAGMEEGVFSLEGILTSCAGKKKISTLSLKVAEKLKTERYVPSIHVNYIEPSQNVKKRTHSGEAHLTFETGKSVLKEEYGRNYEELRDIERTLEKVGRSGDFELRRIGLEGYASPEGSWRTNRSLSERRVKSVESYLQSRHRLSSSLFESIGIGEDWQGLRALVEEGNLRDKKEILAVIDSGASPDEKERRLKQMGMVWNILMYDYFPRLRRVKYEIVYEIRDFETEELARRFIEDPGVLSAEELFRMAEEYGIDSEEWHLMLLMAADLYPDDAVVLINAAASHLVQGEILEAGELLKEVLEDKRAYNNIGAFYLLAGDTEKAERYLKLSTGVRGTEANLRELEKVKSVKRRVVSSW